MSLHFLVTSPILSLMLHHFDHFPILIREQPTPEQSRSKLGRLLDNMDKRKNTRCWKTFQIEGYEIKVHYKIMSILYGLGR